VATNLDLDDGLIEEAKTLGEHRTKKAAVTAALEEYVRRHRQMRIFELEGEIRYEEGYDPLEFRRSTREKPDGR